MKEVTPSQREHTPVADVGGAGQVEVGDSLLRTLIKHTPAAIAMFDRELRYLEVSDRWITDYHLDARTLIGRSHYDVFPDIPERWKQVHQRVLRGAVERCEEDPFPRADGSFEWLTWEVRPWRTTDGEVGGVIMLTQVVTQRKQAEAERARLTHELNERVKELTVLHKAARLLQKQCSQEQLSQEAGQGEPGQWHPVDATLLKELVLLLPQAWQYPEVCEARVAYAGIEARTAGFRESPWAQAASFATSHGQIGTVEVVYLEQRPPAGEGPFSREERSLIESLADMLRAHVERRHNEQELRKAEQKFSSVFMAAPVGIVITHADGCRVVEVNREFERLLGYSREEAVGRTTLDLGLWPDPALREAYLERAASPGGLSGFEADIRVKDGTMIPLRISAQTLELDEGSFLLSAFVDLSEQKRAEASIRESERRLRRVVESPILGFAFCSSDGVVHDANDEYLRIVGRTRAELAEGRVRCQKFDMPENHKTDGSRGGAQDVAVKPREVEIVRPDGLRVPVLMGGSKIDEVSDRCVAFVFDLTERRDLERQLQQAQRMEAIGRLAAGVAHDFNNVLSAITLSSELLLEDLTPAHPAGENVAEIRKAADRAAALTRQLLAFSRQQVLEPRVIDLNDLIIEIQNMLRRIMGEDVQLETHYEPALGNVRADLAQIQQVILNLAVNARDAMPGGGKLRIETSNVEPGASLPFDSAAASEGSWVMLAVTDTGVGMDVSTKSRMFEPFFTTKEPGTGTGLGLAMVYGIVRQSGGGIDVASEPGKGSTFRIFLPRVNEVLDQAPATVSLKVMGGKETVLLVEDDAWVRLMTRKVLSKLGYRILEAATPWEARELVAVYAGPIDVLLTDLVMPGTSGRALATELVALRPKLRVLLMSGYTDDTLARGGSTLPGFSYIQKPFASADLAQRLRAVLSAGRR